MASNDEGSKLGWFLFGASLGAIVALLFAPKSGRELREDIADTTRRGIDRASEGYQSAKEKAIDVAERGREKASELIDQAKSGVTKQKGRLGAALEAGKAAYVEERNKAEVAALEE